MKIIRKIFDRRGAPILLTGFVLLFFLEKQWRLRNRKEPVVKRSIVNAVTGIPAFFLLRILFLPAMVKIAKKNRQLQLGLNYRLTLPSGIKFALAFLIMDFSNYFWHILNHKVTWLWRFHVVHHSDRDLDVTTALRFHFGELLGSVFFRGAFIFIAGATAKQVLIYEIIFEAATQFHHSNLKMTVEKERLLNKIIVTPRMHGIHHSVVRQETDSNYSVIFSFWDRLFNTVCLNVPQQKIVIGLPEYTHSGELTIGALLAMPFRKLKSLPNKNSSLYSQSSFSLRNHMEP